MTTDKSTLDKVSVWEGPDDHAVTLDARIYIYQRETEIKLKVKSSAIEAHADLPDGPESLTDWCVTATDTTGEHYHGAAETLSNSTGIWTTIKWRNGLLVGP